MSVAKETSSTSSKYQGVPCDTLLQYLEQIGGKDGNRDQVQFIYQFLNNVDNILRLHQTK